MARRHDEVVGYGIRLTGTRYRKKSGKKGKMMKSEPGFPVLGQAVPAIDRPAFRGLERDFAFLSTV
jgi:hypothetical protein